MEIDELIIQVVESINYQENKLDYLWDERERIKLIFLEQVASNALDTHIAIMNQVLTDSLLNAMASMVDYYCMYCFLKMGAEKEKITKIQYRPMNNRALRTIKHNENKSLETIKLDFDKYITEISKKEISDISVHDYWSAFFGDAANRALFNAGITSERKFGFEHDIDGFKINKNVRKFHYYMQYLYCNRFFYSGVKYNIYFDVNNCLKHNIVPHVTPKLEKFGNEERAFLYMEFKNDSTVFLRDGLLKKIIDCDFNKMKEELEQLNSIETSVQSSLEQDWEMDNILKIDKGNGYISQDENTLYFFVDNVLIAKTRDATLVDVGISLKRTVFYLVKNIREGMSLELSEFD